MHKTNGAGHIANMYVNEDVALSRPPTEVPAVDLNAFQEELANIATMNGETLMTPSTDTFTQARDAIVTKIRNMINGGDYKDSVRFTTTANIVLSGLGTQAGGDWPAPLTAGDRILPKNQTAGAENGLYNASAGAWVRATGANTGAEFNSGAIIPVESSATTLADTNWQLTTDGVIVVGTTALTFTQIPSQFASNAEILAGVIANKFVSPLGLVQGLLGLGGATNNDYINIPFRDSVTGLRKNLILQWGLYASVTSGTTGNLTFPIAFPSECKAMMAMASNTTQAASMSAARISASQFTITSTYTSPQTTFVIAIGF